MLSLFRRSFSFSTFSQTQLLQLRSFQQKTNAMDAKKLIPLPQEEKHWMQRIVGNFFADFNNIDVFRMSNTVQTDGTFNTPTNSWVQLNIPFTTDPIVQSVMFRFDNEIRIGRLLEFLDLFAGFIGYKYCNLSEGKPTMTLVTACVDNVEFYSKLSTKKDIALKGYVTYVGKTSIEVRIDIYQIGENKTTDELIGSSLFLMVARDINNLKQSLQVPRLILDNEETFENCQFRYQVGSKNQKNRKLKLSLSLQSSEPTSVESKLLHQFFTHPQDYLNHTPIQNTVIQDTNLMQFEYRNVHNKIFGGFLMRKFIEQGWLCGYLHVKGLHKPAMVYLSDIQFHDAVEIGQSINFISHVCYTFGNYMDIKMEAYVINPENRKADKKTTEMHLILECPEIIPPVFPEHYEHGILYLEGKRVLEEFLESL